MKTILDKGRELILDENGATAPEYAIMLALVIAVVIGAVAFLGRKVNNTFNNMGDKMPNN